MKHAPRAFIWDNVLAMTVYWASSGAIISSLTEYFGFSLAVSNFITGFTGTLPIFQLIGGLAYSHTSSPLRFLRISNGLWRLFIPFVFFSVLFPGGFGAPVMLISYTLGVAIYQFSAPSQISWMSSCVDGQVPSNYYSVREMFFMAAYTVVLCAVSLTVDWAERSSLMRTGFTYVGLLCAVLLSGSLIVLARLPAPPVPPKKAPALNAFFQPFIHKGYRRVITANMVWCFANMFIGGFSAVYQVRILNVSFFQIMLWMTVANICRTIFTPLMSRLADRTSWKSVTSISLFMMSAGAVFWLLSSPANAAVFFPLATVLGAIPYAGLAVGLLKLQIANSPEESRSVFVSVLSLMNGLAALLGSAICSALIRRIECVSVELLRYLFILGIVFSALAAFIAVSIPYRDHHNE